MGDDLRWAVMGTGTIAGKVLPLLQAAGGCRVTCVASREVGRAAGLAEAHGVGAACVYDELGGRDDVDAVYVTLPNHLHGVWCRALLEAGKHVVCEKPLTAFEDEARAVFAAAEASGRRMVEGFMYMHHPQTSRLVEIGRAGDSAGSVIGPLVRMEGRFDINLVGVEHAWTRFCHSMWGGALMDLGCYPVGLSRLIAGVEPRVVGAEAVWAEVPERESRPVDVSCAVEMEFEMGGRVVPATSHCSMGAATDRCVLFRLEGEWGSVETGSPFKADPERAVLRVERNASHPRGAGREEIVIEDGGERFENQFADFARVVGGGGELLPSPEWSIGQARVLEGILERIGLEFPRPAPCSGTGCSAWPPRPW